MLQLQVCHLVEPYEMEHFWAVYFSVAAQSHALLYAQNIRYVSYQMLQFHDESTNLHRRALLKFESVLTSPTCSSLKGVMYEQMMDFHQAWDNASLLLDRSYILARQFASGRSQHLLFERVYFNILPFLLCMPLAVLDSESSEALMESLEIIPWTTGAIVIQMK